MQSARAIEQPWAKTGKLIDTRRGESYATLTSSFAANNGETIARTVCYTCVMIMTCFSDAFDPTADVLDSDKGVSAGSSNPRGIRCLGLEWAGPRRAEVLGFVHLRAGGSTLQKTAKRILVPSCPLNVRYGGRLGLPPHEQRDGMARKRRNQVPEARAA